MALPENETRLDEAALVRLLAAGTWRREGSAITRTFTFKGFKSAMAFANRVAEAANAANHHPDIHVEQYRTVRIVLTTHATGGITDADVELARLIDELEALHVTRP
jgi:4a-hydroxytetrahydrobiopterin dehydratase